MTRSTAREGAARAVADLAEGTILATVEIAAAPERVFRALTDPAEIVRWWGAPDAYRTTEWNADLRVGGRFRSRGVAADGSTFALEGEYLEVDPPHKLVHTWMPGWDPGATTTVSYRLEAIAGGGTRVTLRHTGFAGRVESCRSHGSGWERVLGWLDAHAAPPPAQTGKLFFCKLIPPRPSFPFDMTEAERAVMQAHVGYWQAQLNAGVALLFGPVADPSGAWGAGVVRVPDATALQAHCDNDPAIRSGVGFRYETYPMLNAVLRGA
jgi:uncharacterized protein YndB with AHSA1/START domain